MPQLSVSLFGSFRVLRDGQPITAFRSDKIRALFAYLALQVDRAHRRDTLMGLFWPDLPEQQAQNNLRVSLHRLRETLGDRGANARYFQITHESVRFVPPDDYVLDVARFTHLFDTSRCHPHPSLDHCHECMRRLEEAAALYRGDLLAGLLLDDSLGFAEWALFKREWLHRQALELLYQLASHQQRYGRWEQARAYVWRQLELEPWREEAHRQLMEILARSGERSAALAQYATCRRVLAKELGVEPDEETRRLYERILAMRQGPDHNLPAQLTSFVGRQEELAKLARRLREPEVRLLTVVGPGGIGKTRLALQAAEEQIRNHLHGVYVVELAGVRAQDTLLSTIAKSLRVRFEGREEPQAHLVRYLEEKEMLLVLDNAEHMLGEVGLFVIAVLASAPRIKVLATSRERLHLSGEHVFVVPPLTLPDPKHMPPAEQLTQFEAMRLFIARAQAVKADFQLTSANAPAVAEICCRVDGLPLAIELAAARVQLLPPPALLERFRLTLLAGGARDLPLRQQTLSATLDWSYILLNAEEQLLFRRLAVFVGGWTLEAAEAVGNVDGKLLLDVLGGLQSLLDKNLLYQHDRAASEVRFGMLETIHEYAWEQLAGSGEAEAMQRAHAEYYLTLAEQAELELHGPQQAIWLERLEQEHANLHMVLRWAKEHGEVALGLRLSGALSQFWYMHGHLSEGRGWLAAALAWGRLQLVALRPKALHGASTLAWGQGDYAQATALLEEKLELDRELGNREGIAASLHNLGRMAYEQGDYAQARALLEESLALLRELGHKRGIASSLNDLGVIAREQGDYGQARVLHEESLALLRELGSKGGMAYALNDLGQVAHEQGDYGQARALLEESLALRRELGHKRGIAASLGSLGLVALSEGNYARAAACFEESLGLSQELGSKQVIAECLEGLAGVAGAQGQAERAARLWGAAEQLRSAIGARLPPVNRARYERALATTRAQVDEEAFAAAWAEGRAMPLEEAVAYALTEEGNSRTAGQPG